MGYREQRKAQVRHTVVHEAAAAIRAHGPERVTVAAMMSHAGLTHGSFYAHFSAKEELMAEAVDYMFADAKAAFLRDTDGLSPDATLKRYIDRYLSSWHRDVRSEGCPVPALAGEIHRLPENAQERFSLGIQQMRQTLCALLLDSGAERANERAACIINEMVGAILIARSVSEPEATELLSLARQSVHKHLSTASA